MFGQKIVEVFNLLGIIVVYFFKIVSQRFGGRFVSHGSKVKGQHTANNLTYDIKDCGNLLIDRYKRAKENKGILGTPWPWQSLNDETMGILPKGWYVFFARPGAGKTTTVIGCAAYIFSRFNKRIGVFNFEDDEEDLLMLFTCYLAGIDFILCKHGKLNPADEERYETACNELTQYTNKTDKCFLVEQAQGCNMAQIKSKIEALIKSESILLIRCLIGM